MIDAFPDIPLREAGENSPFRKDHAQHGMHVFNSALLIAAHWGIVINTGAYDHCWRGFQTVRVVKLHFAVGQYH